MKTISQLMEQMIVFSNGNLHDITHFITVWTYAKTIGELEGLDADTQYLLEATAIVHDIACPSAVKNTVVLTENCRKKKVRPSSGPFWPIPA